MTNQVQQPRPRTEWEDIVYNAKQSGINLYGLVVCLDNGHGKATPGKASPCTLHENLEPKIYLKEYDFNRRLANKVKELLEVMGADVYMVCPEVEGDISLSARAARANKYKVHYKNSGKAGKFIFVSIHGNAFGEGDKWYPGTDGWSVWTTKGQNTSDLLATCLWEAADEILKPMGRRIRKEMSDGDPDWESDFTVIKKASMPAVLTENFFYTDPEDCKFMSSEAGLNAMARVHAEGIVRFAKMKYNIG